MTEFFVQISCRKINFFPKFSQAMESDYVSSNLNKWIDLIFGYKQRGKSAEQADNIFYHLCYEGSVDIETIHDLEQRYALEVQIGEFGQVPKQLFSSPHPGKPSLLLRELTHMKLSTSRI